MALTTSQQQALTKLRSSGASDLGVALDNARLAYLLSLIVRDLDLNPHFPECPKDIPELFERGDSARLAVPLPNFVALYERLLTLEPNADTYLFCLGSLLKARLKYEKILRAQPLPTIEQIGPRSLLQFGQMETGALAAFLFWRKWIYDIDNRAGQETGYLFEPIVAQAIGGVPFGARNSPVRRGGDGKGRQVDCIKEGDDTKRAYELKLRVTIAASGQGRWGEELSFPHDCVASGFRPVLVVFDDTANDKLAALVNEFESVGGECFVGAEAWRHLEEQAGVTMSRFIDKYVMRPIEELLHAAPDTLPPITFSLDDGKLIVAVDEDQLIVTRVEDPNIGDDLLTEAEAAAGRLPDDVDESTASV